MLGILTFILVFGIIVVVHEFGHFYFAKKSGILVREFAVGMGPKIFAHIGKDGTAYTVRILPLGGYVRMAGWGEDKTEIKTGTPASLTVNPDGLVTRINLSGKQIDPTALPMNVTSYDLEDKLTITGLVLEETKTYQVDHDATIIEEDGTEVRIAPLDVQYQNASVFGRMITNFAGPLNNFILGVLVYILLMFAQGGVQDVTTNHVQVVENGALAQAGLKNNDQILAIEGIKISNWEDLVSAVDETTRNMKSDQVLHLTVKSDNTEKEIEVTPKKSGDRYLLGVSPGLKTGFFEKIVGGITLAWDRAFLILDAFKNLILQPDLNKLGGPVAMYQMTSSAAQSGLIAVLNLMGLLSINLGIFNLFPIPALDGGKLVMNILEAIRKKPLKQETETYITLAGVVFMVLLMVAVTWNDIVRAFF